MQEMVVMDSRSRNMSDSVVFICFFIIEFPHPSAGADTFPRGGKARHLIRPSGTFPSKGKALYCVFYFGYYGGYGGAYSFGAGDGEAVFLAVQ